MSRFSALALLLVAFAASDVLTQTPATAPQPEAAPLADLRVPPGFRIAVFASDLQGARLMAVSPEGVLLVARRRTHEVVALPDANKDGVAEPEVILTGLTNAHSLAFKDGYLYIATTPAVMRVRWANGRPAGEPETFAELPNSTPSVHVSRTIGFGQDGRLYVSIGSSCNVCVEPDPRRTTIQVFTRRLEARAVRDRTAQRDRVRLGSGDRPDVGDRHGAGRPRIRLPAGRDQSGRGGQALRLSLFRRQQPSQRRARTEGRAAHGDGEGRRAAGARAAGAHDRHRSAVLHGDAVPARYRDAMFVALHGSSTIPEKVGYKVVRIVMKDGRPAGLEDFVTGWLKDGVVSGRPAGLMTGADGALYISDDNKGFIYRVSYGGQ